MKFKHFVFILGNYGKTIPNLVIIDNLNQDLMGDMELRLSIYEGVVLAKVCERIIEEHIYPTIDYTKILQFCKEYQKQLNDEMIERLGYTFAPNEFFNKVRQIAQYNKASISEYVYNLKNKNYDYEMIKNDDNFNHMCDKYYGAVKWFKDNNINLKHIKQLVETIDYKGLKWLNAEGYITRDWDVKECYEMYLDIVLSVNKNKQIEYTQEQENSQKVLDLVRG